MSYVKAEIINLKNHPIYNEKWLWSRIEEDPSILGLGDLDFKYTEKIQISGGRLDTILYDSMNNKRYEVEIQLGATDEKHIIRTIEYWDIERKRNPQYDHCAVIIAEEITSRFFNVISLFNGAIPLIAIQVKAIKVGENVSLFFTTVLGENTFELNDDDIISEPKDRNYWENRATPQMLKLVDDIKDKLGDVVADYELKYNKHYIGIATKQGNIANNFINFRARKDSVILHIKLSRSNTADDMVGNFDNLPYDRWGCYRIRLKPADLQNADMLKILQELTLLAKDEYLG